MSREASTKHPDVPRDRITGVSAPGRRPGRVRREATSDEIEQEIRRTRARMSTTLDDIEGRLAPARLKRELKHSVHDTIEDVKQEFHPKHMAKRAGDTMIDTLKDHPLATAAAGASVGYLIFKGAEGNGRRSADGRYDYPTRNRHWPEDEYYARAAPQRGEYRQSRVAPYDGYGREYDDEGRHDDYSDRARQKMDDARKGADEAKRKASHVKEEARSQARDVQHRAGDVKDRALSESREAAQTAQRRAKRAGSELENFVYDNPLAAGAVAVGIGAILGGLFPSTKIEDRYMGPARDDALNRARHVAEETAEHGKQAGEDLAQHAKGAAKEVADTAKTEATGGSTNDQSRSRSSSQSQTGSRLSETPTRDAS